MDYAFEFEKDVNVCTEASYPYKAAQSTCKQSSCSVGIPKGGVVGYTDVASDNMQALMSAVSQQPVSIAIEADQSAFQMYTGGVLTKNCGSKLDHGVLLVGYGTDSTSNLEYWKVKNSWGASWGEEGYIRLERGGQAGQPGECGIKSQPSYPKLAAPGDDVDGEFAKFMQEHGRHYKSQEESEARFQVFKRTLARRKQKTKRDTRTRSA